MQKASDHVQECNFESQNCVYTDHSKSPGSEGGGQGISRSNQQMQSPCILAIITCRTTLVTTVRYMTIYCFFQAHCPSPQICMGFLILCQIRTSAYSIFHVTSSLLRTSMLLGLFHSSLSHSCFGRVEPFLALMQNCKHATTITLLLSGCDW